MPLGIKANLCVMTSELHAGSNLYAYDTVAMTWNLDTASGTPPSSRTFHGFTEMGGKLYVHGGYKSYGMPFNSRRQLL
jgi:hypothetical protein